MATRANPLRKARPRWWWQRWGDAAQVGVADSAVFSNDPVYALVLEEVPGDLPHAKVLFENGDYEKPNGDQIDTIRQLQNAVIHRVLKLHRDFDFDGDPRVFAEDPREGGTIDDSTEMEPKILKPDIAKVSPSQSVDTARGRDSPYFVLVRRKLAAAAAEIAGVGEAFAGPEAWDGKEDIGSRGEEPPGVQICYEPRSAEEILGMFGTGLPRPTVQLAPAGADAPPRSPADLRAAIRDIVGTMRADFPEALRQLLKPDRTLPLSRQTVLFPALMDRADIRDRADHAVWATLQGCFSEADTAGRSSFVFLTGTSGVGKSKIAADLGKEHALVVTVPVKTSYDDLSASSPYTALFSILDRLRTQAAADPARKPQLQRRAIIIFAHMMLSHVEIVLDGCEYAKDENSVTSEVTLLEVAIRMQWRSYTKFVVEKFTQVQIPDDEKDATGQLWARFAILRRRCRDLFPDKRVVMFHDEAQFLLKEHGADEFFQGTWRNLRQSRGLKIDADDTEAPSAPKDTPHTGLFYALLCTIRYLSDGEFGPFLCNVVAGTNMKMTYYMLTKESPAQGAAEHVNVATCLSADDIRNWCASYLSDDAMAALDQGTLHALQGRPLYASWFWRMLVMHCSSDLSVADNVQNAAIHALEKIATGARKRVQSLWQRDESRYDVCGLYYSLKAGHGGFVQFTAPAMSQVEQAVLEGVLNITLNPAAVNIDLGEEPATAKAILDIGNEFLATTEWHDDPVIQALQGRRFGFFGSEKAKGELLEELFVWHVLKTCHQAGRPVTLKEVLWVGQDDRFWPKALDGHTVHVKYGLRCPPTGGGFLSKFAGENGEPRFDVILHHPPDGAASADVLFPAMDAHGNFRQVEIQAKDMIAAGLPDALRSLDMGTWFPDQMTRKGPVRRQPNRDFVDAFSEHPEWFASPVRVVLHTKQFTPAVLCTAAYYNVAVVPEQPIVLTTFGLLRSHEIGPSRIDNPKRLTTFTPTPVPCWEETEAGKKDVPHPHQYLEGRPVFAELKELPDAGDTLLITCDKGGRDEVEKRILSSWQSARLVDDDDDDCCCKITITFAHVHDAIECQLALERDPHGYWRNLGVRSVKVKEALNKRRT